MNEYQNLKQLLADIEPDVIKAFAGNKAAGTRVRKAMQDIKAAAQVIREKVLEARSDDQPEA
jgi:hypothetical protein